MPYTLGGRYDPLGSCGSTDRGGADCCASLWSPASWSPGKTKSPPASPSACTVSSGSSIPLLSPLQSLNFFSSHATLGWQYPYSVQQLAHSGQPSDHFTSSAGVLKGGKLCCSSLQNPCR